MGAQTDKYNLMSLLVENADQPGSSAWRHRKNHWSALIPVTRFPRVTIEPPRMSFQRRVTALGLGRSTTTTVEKRESEEGKYVVRTGTRWVTLRLMVFNVLPNRPNHFEDRHSAQHTDGVEGAACFSPCPVGSSIIDIRHVLW